ncbi:tRNA uridine-5-carboxymethylaminomethyl(34) synthesis GTPase MnmE [Thalassovita mangrovi]|uniref:tRNA modification GTPase MnmE n=1 Tax=Thalassovita mangrovi TaxID=2692236 RepID=A0A6L8LGY1_9RHOB|nr:tRNA uridine-5-carboxymethylaminomethyl(34) synthesis GTPase MnmE [Thalassovita mangrovi]MYM55357.1 tRNA uridine-5-carboxymethylaminomethyl(34) synthesis GTPase MnmE [Thalassovita mangrovi]
MDTIFALATAHGKAGVAVIRVSGPMAFAAGETLAGSLPEVRKAGLRLLKDGQGVRLDEALILCFEDKASFTGEAVVEFQLHGSTAVIAAVLRELGNMDGLRQADPGEFTRRALENGRLDLAQVEGLADLIEAETEAQRRQALRVLSGDLGNRAEEWRRDLIRAASLLEATIDFADEDIPVDVSPEVNELLDRVIASLSKEIAGVSAAERVRTGFEVAIIGAPNVGKSTLLNALAGRDAAITSEYAGTTRDVIEVRMDLAGLPVTLLDTAGLRETQDKVEEIGIQRARERAGLADLRVFLVEGDQKPDFEPQPDDIVLKAKADLLDDKSGAVSGASGEGVANLIDQITERLSQRTANIGIATRERHRVSMQNAVAALDEAKRLVAMGEDMTDIAAEEMRTAIRALDALVGRIDVENLLDEIFASFCLGK